MINLSMAEPDNILRPRLSVVGVGGAGGNAINNMIRSNLEGCDFIVANTDSQALAQSLAPRKIQLGVNLSRGLGAGSKPDVGRAAAEEQINEIMSILEGSDMLFVTAGMGGGTGTGAAPVIARAARESGILTVGVVTKPFNFEGKNRMKQAEMGIEELQRYVDTLIVIPNQNLFRIATERTSVAEAFRMADEVLYSGVRGITDLMVMPGFMNLDFADVKTVMGEMGKAMLGTGEAEGENRAIRAAEVAISNPLLDDISMKGARGVLINITGSLDMTLFEMDEAANRIREEVDSEAQIKVGSTLDETLNGRIRVSVIATGIDAAIAEQERKRLAELNAPKSQLQPQPQKASVFTPPPVAAKQVTATTVTSTVNLSANYFTMPQAVTAQTVTAAPTPALEAPVQPDMIEAMEQQQATAEKVVEETASSSQAVYAEPQEVEEVQETPRVRQAAPQVVTSRSAPPATVSPLRAPTSQRPQTSGGYTSRSQEQAKTAEPDNMRVTQIASSSQPRAQGNGRSQSLFQRITGFGMVRPSARDDDFEEEQPQIVKSDFEPDSSDRPALSGEASDLLDIPAFLRRQTNH